VRAYVGRMWSGSEKVGSARVELQNGVRGMLRTAVRSNRYARVMGSEVEAYMGRESKGVDREGGGG